MPFQAQSIDERIKEIQVVYDILNRIEMPTGEEDWFIVKFQKGKELEDFLDYKERGYVAGLIHPQDTLLGQLITKEVFGKKGIRYAHLTFQSSYDRTHYDKNFRRMIKNYWIWIWNREVILQEGKIISDPIVVETNEGLKYDGKSIKAEINEDDVFDTLIKAGLSKEPKEDVYRGPIYFDNNGVSAVGFGLDVREPRFIGGGVWPSYKDPGGLSVFGKTKEMPEPEKVEIAKNRI